MDWKEYYQQHKRTATQAIARIQSGQRVFIGSNAAEPQTLVEALTASSEGPDDIEIVHILTLGCAPYAEPQFAERFRHNAFFIGPNVREAVNACRADYTPIFLSEVPALFERGEILLDVALISVSPPDEQGLVSLGVSVDVVRAAVEGATLVIAEVNAQMPRTAGNSRLNVREIDIFVESTRPLPQLLPPLQTDATRRIGRHIADLIEDGATLQMGIGAIPDAVLACLGDKKDLGIHTEMFSDGVLPLLQSGVINGRRKVLNPGKVIASFCMGTTALYEFLDNNPTFEFHPSDYVNTPSIIGQNNRMIAINSAIEVDLTGQVCADSIGDRFYSGIGGQVDFVRGAAMSRGGKPIIALPSTTTKRDGTTVSRIVPFLQEGAGVVTSRGDVHYVVTEFGVAYLHGKSIRERSLALIRIAHPDFRTELLYEAKERHLIPADQPDCGLNVRSTESWSVSVQLTDGTPVLLRPICLTDEELLREFHYRLSEQTITQRHGYHRKTLLHHDRLAMVNVDYDREMALIVTRPHGAEEEMLGVGRYHKDANSGHARLFLTVRDDWQNRGIGSLLLEKLITVAREKGLMGLYCDVPTDNPAMTQLLEQQGFAGTRGELAEVLHFHLHFDGISNFYGGG